MPRYINVDKIIEHLNDEIEGCGDCDVYSQPVVYGTRLGLEYSKSLVETAETADVAPVVHGRWINKGEYAVCMECSGWSGTQYNGVEQIPLMTQFCPNCGAKMDNDDFCSRSERRKEDVDA